MTMGMAGAIRSHERSKRAFSWGATIIAGLDIGCSVNAYV